MKFRFVILLLSFSACLALASAATEVSSQKIRDLRNYFLNHPQDLTNWNDLQRIPKYASIYRNPTPYVKYVLQELDKGVEREDEQMILVSLMHRLRLQALTSFGEELLTLRARGRITNASLGWGLLPPTETSTLLLENHDKPRVRALWEAFAKSPFINERLRKHIKEEVLTGRAAEHVRKMRADGFLE